MFPWELGSFRLKQELLDERPPFFGIGLHQGAERLWRLSLAREHLRSEIGKPSLHGRIGQRLNYRRIEFADDIPRRPLVAKSAPQASKEIGSPISTSVGMSAPTPNAYRQTFLLRYARRGDRAICGLILHPHFRAQSLLECERWRGRRRWRYGLDLRVTGLRMLGDPLNRASGLETAPGCG
jgi:hypothetical protein